MWTLHTTSFYITCLHLYWHQHNLNSNWSDPDIFPMNKVIAQILLLIIAMYSVNFISGCYFHCTFITVHIVLHILLWPPHGGFVLKLWHHVGYSLSWWDHMVGLVKFLKNLEKASLFAWNWMILRNSWWTGLHQRIFWVGRWAL